MSTPEEQQRRQYAQQQSQQQEPQQQSQPPQPQDPYGTQTWQADTWDTGYQPVHPPLGAVPGQPVAPEGWFRDEAAAQAQAAGAGAVPGHAEAYPSYEPHSQPHSQVPVEGAAWGAAAAPEPQGLAPEGWFRDEAQAPAEPAPAPQDWSQGGPGTGVPAPASAAETAYLPPYPGPGAEQAAAAEQTAYLPPYPGPAQQQAVAPEGWFRDEAPAPAAPVPGQDWSQGAGTAVSAAETAYLPPYPGPGAEQGAAAEQTAYLPPFPGPGAQGQEPAVAAAEQTAYLPPQAAADPAPVQAPAGSAAGAPETPADWSPPTLGGNTLRAVDPAQARAEGRSPIIDPGPQPAILTAALGLLLAAAAALGQFALLVPLIALQGLTAAGWFRLNGMWPARQGIALAFAGALVADAAVLAVEDAYGAGAIVGTLGAWVLLTLVLQLRSHADPDERMYGLMASVASAALAIICAGYLAADTAAVTVGAAAVAVAVFVRALPLPTATSVGVSLASAAGAGVAVGGLTSVGVGGALLGLAAGVCALVGLRVAAYDYPSKFVHMTAGVALPLAAAAPAVYLIGRVVG
ncbi:hypothetical protein ADK91_12955 [Streptomyces sp. XY511]|uniref:hypothetical protein n=1 Tax=Streptomyces TaxID=1883 RepID=UPI0006C068D9|nr:hypothetical protein [Streptomyces sp. XY511]KOV09427.1 hypothetical protein ADK91_12955 [Streptomyces sp. XY511]